MRRNGTSLGRLSKALVFLFVLGVTTGWTAPAPSSAKAPTYEARTPSLATASIVERAATRDDVGLLERTLATAAATREAAARAAAPAAPVEVVPEERPDAAPRRVENERRTVPSHARGYSGKNRVWIPSLGLSQPVVLFPCPRQRPPDNYMYRWGCAGSNNVYLLGHAYSVFKPLHDAYVQGRLKVGMVAMYADGNGRIRQYRVTEWRVVDPVDSHWAIASQPVPSMTLQTCVGKNSQWRLNVRLIAF